ncbi:sensor histidine kinase [Gryllotalpicola koreensis]|uniref:histidine kinase n=1 Tax=Gryllotalpicola koreensis TaxID=993086 RepID=A0ABP8A9Z5_9MICO
MPRLRRAKAAAPAAPVAEPAPAVPVAPAPRPVRRRLRLPRSARGRRALFWVVLGTVAAALYAVQVPLSVSLYGVPVEVVFVIVAAHVGALPLAVWRPREASGLAVIAAFILMLISTGGSLTAPWPWAVAPLITQSLTLAVVAWKDTWWWSLVAWAGSSAASVIAALLLWRHRPPADSFTDIVVFANIALFTIAAAIVLRLLLRTRVQLAEERETSESERTRRQLADERTRIARELHDVVAHGMSILNVQATSAPYRHPGLPPEVVTEFEQIAAQTRTTLAEMRRLLGVLRAEEPGDAAGAAHASVSSSSPSSTQPTAVLEPQPGLAQLPALIEQARQAGAEILSQTGDALERPVDDVVGLSAYRIVQEALSNALRHAPGATVTVTITRDSRMLELTVVNGPARIPVPGSPHRETGQLAGAGFGLRGMRERAGAVGGSVEYGALDAGGWQVSAVLPAHAGGAS